MRLPLARSIALTLAASALALPADRVAAQTGAADDTLVHTVTSEGRTLTLRMEPVAVRAPQYVVRVQAADGAFTTVDVPAARAYLGTVDGDPAAVATAIIDHDDEVVGEVTFDRGVTWTFDGREVTDRRGEPVTSFAFPASHDQHLNRTVRPGEVGGTTYRWDVGYDVDPHLFVDTLDRDVDAVVDAVDRATVQMIPIYETAARLRPAIDRIVIRGDHASDPYDGLDDNAKLDVAPGEWDRTEHGSARDTIALVHADPSTQTGGLASVYSMGKPDASALNGWFGGFEPGGSFYPILRHELGHNWGPTDMHTAPEGGSGPEGPTLMSGNNLARLDGSELAAVLGHRDAMQAERRAFDPVATSSVSLPPYAALDLVRGAVAGEPMRVVPLANDGDANGDVLRLGDAEARSRLGGTVRRDGDDVVYTAPSLTRAGTVDWFHYTAVDATGRTATGVAVVAVDPGGPVEPGGWKPFTPVTGRGADIANLASDLVAGAGSGAGVQLRGRGAATARFVFSAASKGTWRARNEGTGRCLTAVGATVEQRSCVRDATSRAAAPQRWRLLRNPQGGVSLRAGNGRCLAPAGEGVRAGTALVLSPCSRGLSRRWSIGVTPPAKWVPAGLATGTYGIVNAGSGLRVGLVDGGQGQGLVQRRPAGGLTRWQITAGDSTVPRDAEFGDCMDVFGAFTERGAVVGSYLCLPGNANQTWRVLRNPAGGLSMLVQHSGLCLGVRDASTRPNAPLVQLPCTASPAVRWSFVAG